MLDSLRDAFRQAIDNFWTELNREEPIGDEAAAVDEMQRELDGAAGRIQDLTAEMDAIRTQASREEEKARTCLRRRDMAAEIGDQETAKVAEEFAERHRRRARILTDKLEVATRELRDYERELVAMRDHVRRSRGGGAVEARAVEGPDAFPSGTNPGTEISD